jgi:heat shock protein HspQ
MTRKRTMNDKGRRALTRAARAGRNPEMSGKRTPSDPPVPKAKAAKPAVKRSRKTIAAKTPAAADQPVTARGAKAVAKVKAKAAGKGKVRAVSQKAPLAKSPDAVAPSRAQRRVAAEVKTRPRLRKGERTLRVGGRRRDGGMALARFAVGDVVRHKFYPFRGVVFDIDPVFANTDEWWLSIPEQMRPKKNQPFYHLLAENAETEYIAYVSEQNLMPDTTGVPVRHPQVSDYFVEDEDGRYRPVFMTMLN